MYTLTSEVIIGGKLFGGINDVKIKRSIFSLGATAVIKVPATAVLVGSTQKKTKTLTAKEIKVGDPVEVKLGYNDKNELEFKGYIKNINLTQPLEIECEDEFFKCRQQKVELAGTTSLKDLLTKCGLNVKEAETLTLKNFSIKNKPSPSVAQVLAKLQTDYGLNIFFDFEAQLYAVRPMRMLSTMPAVKYELRRNVIKDDSLKYHKAEDTKIQIKAVCFQKDGVKIEATKGGSEGTSKTLYFYDVTDVKELATLAEIELQRYSYDGYEGAIETFLEPYIEPTMVADLVDKQYGERDGKYYVESVETSFGRSGARRKIDIGLKQ